MSDSTARPPNSRRSNQQLLIILYLSLQLTYMYIVVCMHLLFLPEGTYPLAAEQFQVDRELLSPPMRTHPSSRRCSWSQLRGEKLRMCVCSGHYIKLGDINNVGTTTYVLCSLLSLSLPSSPSQNAQHACAHTHICTCTLFKVTGESAMQLKHS